MDVSWIITIALAVVVALVVVTEIRYGRRNKVFHQKIDPEIEKLQTRVITKYREKFGREPTGMTAALTEHPPNNGVAAKKA
jgi:hypothetical protein